MQGLSRVPSRGFTLIEAIIYIALLSFIMTGAVVTSYQLAASSTKLSVDTSTQEEGDFVLRKIDWALNGTSTAASITTPLPGSYGASLALTRTDGTTVRIRKNGTAIEISKDGGSTYVPLTTSNVSVTSLSFHAIAPVGTQPAGIEASTTINGTVFYTERYSRK